MAQKFSQELTLVDGQGAERVDSGDFTGRVRRHKFSFNTTDEGATGGALAALDTIELARFYTANITILGIFVTHEDLGTDVDIDFGLKGLNSVNIDKAGTADDPDFFTIAAPYDAAAAAGVHVQVATTNLNFKTDKAVVVEATIIDGGTIAITLDQDFDGYVLYVAD